MSGAPGTGRGAGARRDAARGAGRGTAGGAGRIAAVAAIGLGLAVALAGCFDESGPWQPTPSSSASTPASTGSAPSTPSASPTPTETASPTPSPTPTGAPAEPIEAGCEELVSLDALYEINPNLSLIGAAEVAADSAAGRAVAAGGVACAIQHNTTGVTIIASVAKPGSIEYAAELDRAGDAFDLGIAGIVGRISGSLVSGFGAGVAEGAWFTADSADTDPSDLALVIAMLANAVG